MHPLLSIYDDVLLELAMLVTIKYLTDTIRILGQYYRQQPERKLTGYEYQLSQGSMRTANIEVSGSDPDPDSA